jgi:signal transduction histidine kinase
MFKNLRTSTKLTLLCTMFIISIGATTYSLVAEKQTAIAFARKELIGSKFLETLRSICVTALTGRPFNPLAPEPDASAHKMLEALTTAQSDASPALRTGEFVQAVSGALPGLGSNSPVGDSANAIDLLAKMQQLASRIGDDSNLTLDTDLDTYYLQNILVDQLPKLLGRLGELRMVTSEVASAAIPSNQTKAHVLVLDGLIESATGEIKNNLAAAYRGNADESLKRAVDSTYAALFSTTDAYLAGLKASGVESGATETNRAARGREYETVVSSANRAWAVSQSQLDRLLQLRIDMLLTKMSLSLAVTGVLVGLSIVIAIMTYRHIVWPLERLEKVVSTVRETKNYNLRIHDSATNEIGRLASAFDEMLAELASARDRERLEQAELARVARLATAGELSAAIAHEVKQPLAAMVAQGSAALRWLGRSTPDLDETRAALQKIVNSGHRASRIIENLRAMFKKDANPHKRVAVNGIIRDVLGLTHHEMQKNDVMLQIALSDEPAPHVLGDRIQLEQVFLNLVMNAIEAMNGSSSRSVLGVKTEINKNGEVLITIADSGPGIDADNIEKIFNTFFTTKQGGMGMGLSICRSIVEAHGGRIWASSEATPHGSIFYVELPSAA